ncbi:MAG TPA: hypothetical protein VFC82_01200 [Actinomycetaceae bacterium]|nr:hypothetical protein [Actinomycetaceae bacterium]
MNTATPTVWGATKSGRTGIALWGPAFAIGVLIAGVLGVLASIVSPSETPVLLGVVTGLVTLPLATTIGWVLLVDRSSIAGAVERPEDSVESQWLERAAMGALFDGLAMIGLGAAAITITGLDIGADVVLVALWVLLALDLAIRYNALRRKA